MLAISSLKSSQTHKKRALIKEEGEAQKLLQGMDTTILKMLYAST